MNLLKRIWRWWTNPAGILDLPNDAAAEAFAQAMEAPKPVVPKCREIALGDGWKLCWCVRTFEWQGHSLGHFWLLMGPGDAFATSQVIYPTVPVWARVHMARCSEQN